MFSASLPIYRIAGVRDIQSNVVMQNLKNNGKLLPLSQVLNK